MNDENKTATAPEDIKPIFAPTKQRKSAKKTTAPKEPKGPIPVIVTTSHRGVFFGYVKDRNVQGPTVKLQRCRNCIYWDESVKGFVGLASIGPNEKCRIGPAATITLRDVTCLIEVEPVARDAFEAAPWA